MGRSLYGVTSRLAAWSHVPSRESLSGVSFWGVFVREDPPYGGERVVRILLECFLVQNI